MKAQVASNAMSDFVRVMESARRRSCIDNKESGRLNLDRDKVKNGLGQLVLTLVKLLHELLERQAIRRMDSGTLTDSEIESIGVTLMMQAEEINRLRKEFNLDEEDLNLDLGPLGKLL
jgi:hypothetical protein